MTSKKTAKSKRVGPPREFTRTQEFKDGDFKKDWQRLAHSGRYGTFAKAPATRPFWLRSALIGMFDSFYIELDGREQEIQSKRFDRCLEHYRLGDWVSGCLPGVRVYFDSLWLDASGRQVYRAEDNCARKTAVFIVLAQGVFVDYQIHEGELANEAIEPVLRELRERWSDSARFQGFLVETLRTRQQRIASLERQLSRVQSVIEDARRLKAGEPLGGLFGLLHEEEKKLAAGEDPLDVIAWVLSDAGARGWFGGNDTDRDPLEEYRF
jgi:hypothetical protein